MKRHIDRDQTCSTELVLIRNGTQPQPAPLISEAQLEHRVDGVCSAKFHTLKIFSVKVYD